MASEQEAVRGERKSPANNNDRDQEYPSPENGKMFGCLEAMEHLQQAGFRDRLIKYWKERDWIPVSVSGCHKIYLDFVDFKRGDGDPPRWKKLRGKQAPAGNGARKRKAPSSNGDVDKMPRKKLLNYTEAVSDIRDMFLEQASLWKGQSERLIQATRTSTGDASLVRAEPWLSLMGERGRLATVFNENKPEKEDEESKRVEEIKKRLKRTRRWQYKRPAAEQEESAAADEDSDAE